MRAQWLSTALLGLVLAASPVLAQQQNEGTARQSTQQPHSAAKVQMSDSDFVRKAMTGNQLEIAIGRIAETRSQREDVRDLGAKLRSDHTAANEKLQTIAEKLSVQLPASPDLDEKNQGKVQKYTELPIAQFDEQFIREQIKHHRMNIDKYQQVAEGAASEDLREYARETLGALREHLQAAQKIGTELGLADMAPDRAEDHDSGAMHKDQRERTSDTKDTDSKRRDMDDSDREARTRSDLNSPDRSEVSDANVRSKMATPAGGSSTETDRYSSRKVKLNLPESAPNAPMGSTSVHVERAKQNFDEVIVNDQRNFNDASERRESESQATRTRKEERSQITRESRNIERDASGKEYGTTLTAPYSRSTHGVMNDQEDLQADRNKEYGKFDDPNVTTRRDDARPSGLSITAERERHAPDSAEAHTADRDNDDRNASTPVRSLSADHAGFNPEMRGQRVTIDDNSSLSISSGNDASRKGDDKALRYRGDYQAGEYASKYRRDGDQRVEKPQPSPSEVRRQDWSTLRYESSFSRDDDGVIGDPADHDTNPATGVWEEDTRGE